MRSLNAFYEFLHRPLPLEKWKPNWWLLCTAIVAGLFFFAFPGSSYFITGSLLIGAFVAWLLRRGGRRRATSISESAADLEGKRMPLFGPDMQIQNLPTITGHPVGIVIIVGLVFILMRGVPESFPFLFGSIVVGGVIGAVLWWKHR